MADRLINDPSGTPVYIPEEQYNTALKSGTGYSAPTPEQLADAASESAKVEKYEGVGGQAKALGLGVAHGLAPGLAEYAEKGLGMNMQDRAELEARNPGAYGAGVGVGILAPAALSAGTSLLESAPLEAASQMAKLTPAGVISSVGHGITGALSPVAAEGAGIGAKVLAGAGQALASGAGSAAEGALYGAGEVLHDSALGDPDLNAEKIMAEVGHMALFSGTLGTVLGAVPPLARGAADAVGAAKDYLTGGAKAATEAAPVAGGFSGKAGELFQTMEQMKQDLGNNPQELGAKSLLENANEVLSDHKLPVLQFQLDSFDNPIVRDRYKFISESDSPEGAFLRDLQGMQKGESLADLDKTVNGLASGDITPDAYKGGTQFMEDFRNLYKEMKGQDAGVFQQIQELAPNIRVTSADLLKSIQSALPDVDLGKVMQLADDGTLEMQKYNAKLPISRETYRVVKEAVEALEGHDMTLEDFRNVRSSVSDEIKFDMAAKPKAELGRIKKSMMDMIEEKLNTGDAPIPAREAFKRYAINEQNRDALERVFGGKFDENLDLLRQIKPENVGSSIFKNSATMQVVKQVLPPEMFDRLMANHLASVVKDFTIDGKFSSQKFATWLKNNELELQFALSDKPGALDRLKALADKMRFLPDAPPINPSGTAKTLGLMEKLSHLGDFITNPAWAATKMGAKGFLGGLSKDAEEAAMKADMETMLNGGKLAENKASRLGTLERAINSSSEKLAALSGRLFSPSSDMVHAVRRAATDMNRDEKEKKFEKVQKSLQTGMADTDTYLNTVQNSVSHFQDAAPNISQGLQVAGVRGAEFLKSKLPNTTPAGPLMPARKPSDAEISKFLRYHSIVENPYLALKQIKDGKLTGETLEALQTVYPKLTEEMQASVLDKLTALSHRGRNLPNRTKVMLSAFLGSDLTGSMNPQSMQINMMSAAMPSQQQDLQPQKTSAKGAANITLAERSQGELGRVTSRKG